MAQLLSSDEINAALQAFRDIHQTFSRQIVIFKTPTETIIQSDSSQYNFAYEGPANVDYTPVSGIFNARILYGKEDDQQLDLTTSRGTRNTPDIRVDLHKQRVRLKVSGDAISFLTDIKEVRFDGSKFKIYTDIRPHSIIGAPEFYTFYLEKTD